MIQTTQPQRLSLHQGSVLLAIKLKQEQMLWLRLLPVKLASTAAMCCKELKKMNKLMKVYRLSSSPSFFMEAQNFQSPPGEKTCCFLKCFTHWTCKYKCAHNIRKKPKTLIDLNHTADGKNKLQGNHWQTVWNEPQMLRPTWEGPLVVDHLFDGIKALPLVWDVKRLKDVGKGGVITADPSDGRLQVEETLLLQRRRKR